MQTYLATNTETGQFYIGSTKNFERRQKEHLECLINLPFQNSLRKKPEKFQWEIWEDDCGLPVLEQALLDMWCGKELCYNMNPNASHPPSPKGRKVSEKTKKLLSEINTGKKYSPETLEKMRAINKERGANAALTGMQINPKTGKEHPRSRPIVLVNLTTGEEENFDCVADAAKKYGLNDGHLCSTALGKRKKHKGYRARYL